MRFGIRPREIKKIPQINEQRRRQSLQEKLVECQSVHKESKDHKTAQCRKSGGRQKHWFKVRKSLNRAPYCEERFYFFTRRSLLLFWAWWSHHRCLLEYVHLTCEVKVMTLQAGVKTHRRLRRGSGKQEKFFSPASDWDLCILPSSLAHFEWADQVPNSSQHEFLTVLIVKYN